MKKTQVINSELSSILAKLGHTDCICIGDMGLPIPETVQRIDLAISKNIPSLEIVLQNILTEMQVEKIVIAEEADVTFESLCKTHIYHAQDQVIQVEKISHEDFKKRSLKTKAIIRTGEATPYYNIILYSGVTF